MAKRFSDLPAIVQGAIIAAFAVVLAGVVFYLYVLPLSETRTKLAAEVKRLHEENLKNQAVERERTELLNRIASLEMQLANLRLLVPEEPATDQFVRMVHDTAVGTKIHVRSFVAQPLADRDFYVEMPFALRIDGDYYALLDFFEQLTGKKQERIVSVTGLALGPPVGGGLGKYTILPGETVGANCVVTTYFNRPQPPPAPAPPKKR
jgi:type IV pilus assembly protein PilO